MAPFGKPPKKPVNRAPHKDDGTPKSGDSTNESVFPAASARPVLAVIWVINKNGNSEGIKTVTQMCSAFFTNGTNTAALIQQRKHNPQNKTEPAIPVIFFISNRPVLIDFLIDTVYSASGGILTDSGSFTII